MRHLKINGAFFEGTLLANWSISKKINQMATLNCRVINMSAEGETVDLSNIVEGSTIEFYADEEKLFAGLVKSKQISRYAGPVMELSISASDNNEIANRRRIAASIVDKSVGYIVRQYILHVLSEEGVTEGEIAEGPTLTKVNFNYITCAQALNYLQTCSGLNWRIDNDKKLHIYSNEAVEAPFNVTDDTKVKNFKASGKYDQYRNIQYVLGGLAQTSIQENEMLMPLPDGEVKEFYTRLPISTKPIIQIFENGVWNTVPDSDIGVNGLDSGKKFYFSNNSKVITQDNSQEPLATGTRVRASYIGLKDVLVIQKNNTEIANRAAVEGNSGKYESFEKNSSLVTSEEANEYANKLIDKYGEIEDKVSFVTETPGLDVGQLLHVKRSEYNVDDDFLIESISITPIGSTQIEYAITAIDGLALGGWENYFQSIIKGNETIQAEENVIFPKTIEDKMNISEEMNCHVRTDTVATYMGDNTFMQDLTYMGNYQGTEVNISD